MELIFIIGASVLLVVLINILLYKFTKYRAIKYFIKPFLAAKNLEIINTKFTGFFDKGDFGKSKIDVRPVQIMGNIVNDTYIYIYTKENNKVLRYTAKVRTVFFYIKTVELRGSGIMLVLRK